MTESLATRFASLFGTPPAVEADAPGRVNLIGEHTDYNGGFVLPIAIPQRTQVALATRQDRMVRVWSADIPQDAPSEYALGAEMRRTDWTDYVQGITEVLGSAGHGIRGFDLALASEVPVGSGLSSSAALEIAVLRALRSAFALDFDDVEMARLGRRAENEFVGAPVGIMDQMAAALADDHTALYIDTRSLEYERVPMPAGAELAVVNSGIRHDHAAGEYRTRRAECERASALLGVQELRDVPLSRLDRMHHLPAPLDRRVRHVVTENGRVEAARDAMREGDLAELGRLFVASHASMRDDYEVSRPEIDRLVASALEHPECYGARLTGGGFGGRIVILTRAGAARHVAESVVQAARVRGDGDPGVVIPVKA